MIRARGFGRSLVVVCACALACGGRAEEDDASVPSSEGGTTQTGAGTDGGDEAAGSGGTAAGASSVAGEAGTSGSTSVPGLGGRDAQGGAPPADGGEAQGGLLGEGGSIAFEESIAYAPVIVGVDDGVIVAAASENPATVGVGRFEAGIESETFIGHYTVNGRTWSKPLRTMGAPAAMARTPEGDVVVVGAFLPEASTVRYRQYSTQLLLTRVTSAGELVYEKKVEMDAAAIPSSIAIARDGSIYLGGGTDPESSLITTTHYALLVKCDADGDELWERRISSSSWHAWSSAIAPMPNGDLIVTGGFAGKNTTAWGEEEGFNRPTTVVARYTSEGEEIWSLQAGTGQTVPVGGPVSVLPGGDFLLAGTTTEDLELGGAIIDVDDQELASGPPSYTAFLGRFDGEGSARWLITDPESLVVSALAVDGDGAGFIGAVPNFQAQSERVYLRSFDLSTGAILRSFRASGGESVSSSSVSYGGGILWIGGVHEGRVDFGDQALADFPAPGFLAYLADPAR